MNLINMNFMILIIPLISNLQKVEKLKIFYLFKQHFYHCLKFNFQEELLLYLMFLDMLEEYLESLVR